MTNQIRQRMARLLGSTDADERREAAQALAGETDYAAITALAASLQDDNKGVRDAGSLALKQTGGPIVARTVAAYITDTNIVTRNLAGDLLLGLGGCAAEALLPYLPHPDHDVRKFAADIIGVVGDGAVAPSLLPLLKDHDENVALAGVEALGGIAGPDVVPALTKVYHDRAFTRASVTEALGRIGGQDAVDFLVMSFYKGIKAQDADPVVLYAIVEALGRIGDPPAFDMLMDNLQKTQGKLRRALIHAIVSIADRHNLGLHFLALHKQYLVDAFGDRDVAIKCSAAKVLAGIPDADTTELFARSVGVHESLDAILLPALAGRPDGFRVIVHHLAEAPLKGGAQLATVLARLALRESHDVFHGGGGGIGPEDIDAAVAAIGNLWDAANEETHMAIVDALFRLDADKAVTFLDRLLNEPDPWLRIHVIELLGAIEHREAARYIGQSLDDEDEMVKEVARAMLSAKGYTVESGEVA